MHGEAERASLEGSARLHEARSRRPNQGRRRIDVAFIGSCTNGRVSDFREVAKYLKGRKVAPHVKAHRRSRQPGRGGAVREGRARRGVPCGRFEWRGAGCSMCLAMNPDKLIGDQLCASSSNRNFKGRQGSPTGRTILMSPVMVAAAAITGEVADAREVFGLAHEMLLA